MEQTFCRSIRDSVVGFWNDQIEVSTINDQCVITLPIKTLDDRFIDVYVERKLGKNVLVHDGGKSLSELFAQGIHLTDTQQAHLKQVARRHGAVFQHGSFQVASEVGPTMQEAIFAVAQCAAIAMVPVVMHSAVIEDEPLSARVARVLKQWQPPYVDIEKRRVVRGRRAEHVFDFVSYARQRDAKTVAIKLLPPSFGPRVQADRYGFLALDIQNKSIDDWERLAIISKAEEWPQEAIEIVRSFSSDTIELETDDDRRIETVLPAKMTVLTDAA